MSQAFNQPSKPEPWWGTPGSRRRLILVWSYIFILIGSLALYVGFDELSERLGIDYDFAAPESWSTTCLGDTDTIVELLGWDEAEAVDPYISGRDPSHHSYLCEWKWRDIDAVEGDGQELTIKIEVMDRHQYGPYEHTALVADDWWPDYEALNGWEYGVCFNHDLTDINGLPVPDSYKCIASESNLRVTIWSRNSSSDSSLNPKYFGPEEKSVEDMTVELGELVRSVFHE